jgi:phosphoglycolate phosphatase
MGKLGHADHKEDRRNKKEMRGARMSEDQDYRRASIVTPRAVIFDLDGTLLDTLEDIGRSANQVLEELGFPAHPFGAYRQFIGEGIGTLFARALPQVVADNDPALIARCVAGFREAYGQGWNVATRPYPGIPELLDELANRSVRLAVLSNKPDAFVRQCVDEYLAQWPFRSVHGDRDGVPRKPDPAGALHAAGTLEVLPAEILYLGDSSVDMTTACRAGMVPIGAGWGFRTAEELHSSGAVTVINHPLDLLAFLDQPGDRS